MDATISFITFVILTERQSCRKCRLLEERTVSERPGFGEREVFQVFDNFLTTEIELRMLTS